MPKILAIDDTRDNLITISALLGKLIPDCTVITSDSGAEGIRKAEAEQPDTILLDIRMPEMDGFEVCRSLKSNEKTKHIPVVMLTAIKSDAESRVKGLELGADAFLSKPIDEVELAAHVKVMLRIKTAEDLLRKEKGLIKDTVHERTKALRESEKKYRSLFENMLAGFAYCKILLDENSQPIDFIYLEVNDSFEKLTGLKKEDVVGEKVTVAIPGIKETHQELIDIYGKVALTGENTQFDIYFEPLEIWLAISVYCPQKGYFVAILENITERKQAEQSSREAEAELKHTIEVVPGIIAKANAHTGYFTHCNPALSSILGFSSEEFLARPFIEFVHPDDRQSTINEVEKQLKSSPVARFENRYICKDGSYKWLEWMATTADEKGVVYSAATNITKRKQAEETLRESEEKYRSLVESTEDSIYLVDMDCTYLFMNKKHLSRFGMKKDKIIGVRYVDFHSKEETKEFKGRINTVIETNKSHRYIYQSERDGGYYLRTLSPVKDLKGNIIAVTVVSKDITEFKMIEEDLIQANEELSREQSQRKILSKRLIDLLENDRRQISRELHDHVGQILTSLKMDIEMIHGKLKPEYRDLAARITAAQEKTIQAIRDVKNISRGLRPGMLDALGLLPSLRELFNEIQRQTDMEIHFFSRNIPKRIAPENALAIYRIAQEALSNVIRHARAKNIFVNLIKKGEKLSLSAEDDGVGFDQDKVMTFSKKKGPLGLLIMRERAEQLDGDFTLESQIGKGTHLLVEIPL